MKTRLRAKRYKEWKSSLAARRDRDINDEQVLIADKKNTENGKNKTQMTCFTNGERTRSDLLNAHSETNTHSCHFRPSPHSFVILADAKVAISVAKLKPSGNPENE